MSKPDYRRLPSADVAFLHMDRPTNLMVINFVMLFDERVDPARLRELIDTRLVSRYPRFSKLVVKRARAFARPFARPAFVEDPAFDLDRHLHRRELPAPAGEAGETSQEILERAIGALVTARLERSKPLWEMHLLERPGEGCALVVRLHHCIVDGIALASVMLSLADLSAAPSPHNGTRPTRAPDSHARAHRADIRTRGVRAARSVHMHAQGVTRALGKLLLTPPDASTALRGKLGASKRVAWTGRLELADIKAIARAQSVTVNDVLLAAVSGALRRHLLAAGEQPRAIRTLVPFNLRPLDEPIPQDLGNRFGLVFLTLPVDLNGERERLHALSQRMEAIKRSYEGPVSHAILRVMGLTPMRLERLIVDMFTAKASAMTTNVPGPREPVYFAGAPVRAVLVWAPVSGSIGMTVSIFSYVDGVTIGLLVDAGLVPEPSALAREMEAELAALAALQPALTTAA